MKVGRILAPLAAVAMCSVASWSSASATTTIDYEYAAGIGVDSDVTAYVVNPSPPPHRLSYSGLAPAQIYLLNGGLQTVGIVWCYDVTTALLPSGSYDVSLFPNPGAVGALVTHGDAVLAGADWEAPSPTQEYEAEAIQLAIWIEEYPGIRFSGVTSQVWPYVRTYLHDVRDGAWAPPSSIDLLTYSGNQALIAAPETSTWVMALLGFAALGAAGYRRASASAIGA